LVDNVHVGDIVSPNVAVSQESREHVNPGKVSAERGRREGIEEVVDINDLVRSE